MVEKRVHFICRGNLLRSRLAEGYAKSLKLPGYTITSSGIETSANKDTALSPYAHEIARTRNVTGYISKANHQTTQKMLQSQDVLVFFGKDAYEIASKTLNIDARQAVVWEIEDVYGFLSKHPQVKRSEENKLKIAAKIGHDIFGAVDALFEVLEHTSWSDIYDADNKPLGYRLPVGWTTERKGLWRRSVHAVVTTANQQFVVEQRSTNIVFAPNMLDISLGGGVDTGETPRQAVMRELHEELGIKVRPEQVTFLEMRKWSSFHPHYHKYTNTFLYSYHVRLTASDPVFTVQPSEVKKVQLLSARKVKRLIRTHRLRRLGRLNYGYKYYADIVKRAKIYLK